MSLPGEPWTHGLGMRPITTGGAWMGLQAERGVTALGYGAQEGLQGKSILGWDKTYYDMVGGRTKGKEGRDWGD